MIATAAERAAAARIAALEDEVFELREQLGVALGHVKLARLRSHRIPPLQAKCMLLLYERGDRPVNVTVFDMVAPPRDHAHDREPRILDTVVCMVRKRLPPDAIRTIQRLGYVMTPAGRAAVAELLGDLA